MGHVIKHNISQAFFAIYNIFFKANLNSPYGLDRVNEFRYNKTLYEEKSKYLTKKYESPNSKINENYFESWDFFYP